jgi:hypothetical protein
LRNKMLEVVKLWRSLPQFHHCMVNWQPQPSSHI